MDPVVCRRRRVRVSLRPPNERPDMKVLVCGGRDYSSYEDICRVLDYLNNERGFKLLIHGDAGKYKQGYREQPVAYKGADALAGRWATIRGIQQVKVPANWEGLGNKAGMIRNELMLDLFSPDLCIGFPGGIGTNKMMHMSYKRGIEVIDTDDINPPVFPLVASQ